MSPALTPAQEWWTAGEIAVAALPDLPSSRQGVEAVIDRLGWRSRAGLARRREGRGGGWEYSWSLFPDRAKRKLLAALAPAPEAARAAFADRDAAWAWFEKQPQPVQDKARARLAILQQVEVLEPVLGTGRHVAVQAIARAGHIGPRTVWSWFALVDGVRSDDRLPWLAPRHRAATERPRVKDCDPDFFATIKGDYLRLEAPPFTDCHRRAVRVAEKKGWDILPERTMRRRLDATVSAVMQILARKGVDAVKRKYPAQVRDKTALVALEAVNADFHKFDVFVRWPAPKGEKEQILRPQMVALQDIYSGRVLAWRMPAHTGDVTNTAGSLALTIAANAVSNAKLTTMAANTVKANATAGAAVPTDVALAASQLFGRGATGNLAPILLGTNLSMSGATLNAAGGSGSPGGATTQMQFNNAGAFAGASDILVEGGQLRLPTASGTTQPAAGGTKLVGLTKVGRTVPAFLTQDGVVRDIQASLARSSALLWKAMPNNVALSTLGGGAPTAIGTATAAAIATTNLVNYTPRLEYLVTVAATTAIAGFRGVATLASVGGPSAGLGGFLFHGVWGPATGVATTTNRAFFGLANITSAPTDVEPSTSVNCIAMGWDAADTNIQIMTNDAVGTCTKTDLGASFPVPTADRTALYSPRMFSPRGATQTVNWLVTDMVSGATASGTTTTDLPGTTTLLAPRGWISVGGTSSVTGLGVASLLLDPLL